MASDHHITFDVAACRTHLQARQEQQHQAREQRRRAALREVHAAACSILPRFPGVRRAYLFGSVLRPGAMRASSDVDVAIEGKLSAESYFALWRELERAATGWQIDLVELDRNPRFAARVHETGELIYERSDSDAESGHRS
ncbi:MAG: nucleotidyltransferase domain-containing protein [Chloroflexota bacterium]|nr:nucleotidyltransferase domain-containing protein [Chloroflexota bacterium]